MTTKTATHTPGPWKLTHSGYANAPFVLHVGEVDPNYNQRYPLQGVNWIAEIRDDESPYHPQYEANARVIAAAPEMLQALEAIQIRCACRELSTLDRDAQQLILYIIEQTSIAIRATKDVQS